MNEKKEQEQERESQEGVHLKIGNVSWRTVLRTWIPEAKKRTNCTKDSEEATDTTAKTRQIKCKTNRTVTASLLLFLQTKDRKPEKKDIEEDERSTRSERTMTRRQRLKRKKKNARTRQWLPNGMSILSLSLRQSKRVMHFKSNKGAFTIQNVCKTFETWRLNMLTFTLNETIL